MGTKCWMSDASHLILCQQPSAVYFSDVLCAVFLFDVGVGGGGCRVSVHDRFCPSGL